MQGFHKLANMSVISPLMSLDSSKSQQLYHGYPNPKKARLIQQIVLSKPIGEPTTELTGLNLLPKAVNDSISYSSLMAHSTAPYFYSPSHLEPYVINPNCMPQNTTQSFDLSLLPSMTTSSGSLSATNSALSSIFLAGSAMDWSTAANHNASSFQTLPISSKSDSSKQFSYNNFNFPSTYEDCSEVASSLLQNFKSRDTIISQHDFSRCQESTAYLGYEQPSSTWYKVKEESRPPYTDTSGINLDPSANSHNFNYRDIKEKRKCDVCGDISAGFHCNAFVCEACKKFFIRSSKGDNYSKYSCTKSNNCEVVKDTRTHCQYCRFQRCVHLGMTLPGVNMSQSTDISLIPCRVCGSQSSGLHFGAITCEGCKGFFRRSINERENQKYSCRNGSCCTINLATRNNCKSCRYKKCVSVGMSKDGSRIGRQPNAIKHMCAKEINQIRAGLALNQFAIGSDHVDPGLLQSYLPNQLSSAIISSMNLNFDHSRYLQSSVPLTSPDFYLTSNSSKYSIYNLPTQDHIGGHKLDMEQTGLSNLHQSAERLFSHRFDKKVTLSTRDFESEFNYAEKGGPRQESVTEISSDSSMNAMKEGSWFFCAGSSPVDKRDDRNPGYPKQPRAPFSHDSEYAGSIDRYMLPASETKFSVDMPLHKFLSDVNISAKSLFNCRHRLAKQFQLSEDADELLVWDVMMQHFQVHAIQVIKFAKGVPGFKELCHNDMKVLVQESMYPIILVQLARDFNMVTEEYNYFNFTNDEKKIILNRFSIFNKIAEQVLDSGRLIRPKNLDETLFSLVCYIELVKGDTFSIFERNKVNLMYQYSINALRLYMTEIGSSPNEIEGVLEILPILSKMTHEHQEAVMMLRSAKPHLKFPNLYTQMFLVD